MTGCRQEFAAWIPPTVAVCVAVIESPVTLHTTQNFRRHAGTVAGLGEIEPPIAPGMGRNRDYAVE
jgi:hypothetical protein